MGNVSLSLFLIAMEHILKGIAPLVAKKGEKIRAIITDVDGVLTDGGIIYDNTGNELKRFHVRDGHAIAPLRELGFKVGAVTGRNSEVVKFRCRELKFDFHYHGIKDKFAQVEEIRQEYGLEWDEIAFLGDDTIDMPLLEACGLGVVPADAPGYVRAVADYVTSKSGGAGVLREAADIILASQGKLEQVVRKYYPA
jgi:3-deoxy-D-manno-octulosonate 8-phosphate phosphatase (KDO 8-P phosphatase)